MVLSPRSAQKKQVLAEDLLIRRMRDEDVPGVMAIESVSFGRHHWSDESFYNELKNSMGRYYILEHRPDQEVIGYCGLWLVLDEGHVTTVAVKPEYRGNALGEVLLVHMLDRCMGSTIHWVTLEVRAGNLGAQNLYYKYGFEGKGIRPKYYQDNGEDALIMTTRHIGTDDYRTQFKNNRKVLEHRLSGLPEGLGL